MKPLKFSLHAVDQMALRGASQEEVEITVTEGEVVPAKRGRLAFRKNFPFDGLWKGKHYETKQVMPVVAEEPERMVLVTVYVFYFGGE